MFHGGWREAGAGSVALRIRLRRSFLQHSCVSAFAMLARVVKLTGSESQSYSARWLCSEARAAAALAAGSKEPRRISSDDLGVPKPYSSW
jgi:hypothetical protein